MRSIFHLCSNIPVARTYIFLVNGYSRVSYLDFLERGCC